MVQHLFGRRFASSRDRVNSGPRLRYDKPGQPTRCDEQPQIGSNEYRHRVQVGLPDRQRYSAQAHGNVVEASRGESAPEVAQAGCRHAGDREPNVRAGEVMGEDLHADHSRLRHACLDGFQDVLAVR